MSEALFKQFQMTRGFSLRKINELQEEVLDVQPEDFNNTIRWHIGHVLTVTEQFMFGYPKKSMHLPESYIQLFAAGTKPADWTGDIPSLEELKGHLEGQVGRIEKIPTERFQEALKKPFLGLETYGELANMALFHEAHHLGQIHAIHRIVKK